MNRLKRDLLDIGAMPSAEKAKLRIELTKAEERIELGLKAFVQMGRELRHIRDNRLYRGADDTMFEDYVERRWKMTKAHAYRFIKAAECWENVSKLETPVLPVSESQVRPMTSLKPSQRQKVWREVVKITKGEQPTAEQVEKTVARVTGKTVTAKKKPSRVVGLASAICRLGYDATLALFAARLADDYMRDALIIEGDDKLKADIEFGKLMCLVRDRVEQRLNVVDPESDEDELKGFWETLRNHGEWLRETAEREGLPKMSG
jgi:phage-related protein